MKSFFALSTAALLIGLSQTALAEGRSNDREAERVQSRGQLRNPVAGRSLVPVSRNEPERNLQSIDDRLRLQRSN